MMKFRAFALAAWLVIVAASACAQGILPANSGTLGLGQTLVGVPAVAWYKVQQPLVSLTATTNDAVFGVALVADIGTGHGTLPAADFAQSVTANCTNCWLGVQFYSQAIGAASASLVLTASGGAGPETVILEGEAVPGTGLVMTPLVHDFGTVAVHSSSAPVTLMLTNLLPSLSAVTVQSVSVSKDFVLAANTIGSADCAGTMVATGSCFVQVSFAPTAIGAGSGVLTIMTSGGTVTAALTGTGAVDPGLGVNPASLKFTNVPGIAATEQTVVVTDTGTAAVSVGALSVSGAGFSVSSGCSALRVGASCSVVVGFVPQSAPVAAVLSIPVTAGSSTTVFSVGLAGGYTVQDAGMEIVAGAMDFGATADGATEAARLLTVNNLTSKALSVAFTVPREFPLAAVAPCVTLAANASCSFSVGFLPVTGGPLTGSVKVQGTPADGSAAVQALTYLQGYGTPAGNLAITGYAIPNTPLSFGEVASGRSVSHVLTLTNSGTSAITVRRITSEPPFLSTSTCGGALGPAASCSVTVTYAPVDEVLASAGATLRPDVGVLTIESDAVSSPDEVAMTGIAVPAVASVASSTAGLSAFGLLEGALTFGNTQVGNVSGAQIVSMTNTGTAAIHVLSTVVSPDFGVSSTCGTVVPGAGCAFTVTFAPTTATNAAVRSGTLEILSDAGTSLEFVSLVGVSTPAALTLTPTALDFGTVNLRAKETLSVSVENTGAVAVTFLGLSASGDYAVDAGSCPAVLAMGATCVLTVTFAPTTAGTRSGTLSVANDASQVPLTVSLSGVAVAAQLTVTPGALEFGGVDIGFSERLTLVLLNTGNAEVTGISGAILGADAGDFAVTVPCSVTILAPRQGCNETVTFMPSAVGVWAATLSVASSDVSGPTVIALGGTGLAAGTFTLTANGGSSATETLASGSPGTFALLLTPANGFTGTVALTCAPVAAGADMSCSVLPSTLTLGASAMLSAATISTIASEDRTAVFALAGLLILPLAVGRRRRWCRRLVALLAVVVLDAVMQGCGGGGTVQSTVRTTPPGTYKYQVTASSTGGAVVTSSVMLTLVVR